MDRQAGDIDVQFRRMRLKSRRMAVKAFRTALKASRLAVRVVRIGVRVLRISVEVLRISVEARPSGVEVRRLSVEALRFDVEVLRSCVEARYSGVRVRKLFVEAWILTVAEGLFGVRCGTGVRLCGEFRVGAWGRPHVRVACGVARGGLKKIVYRAGSRAHKCAPVSVWGARALHSFNSRRGILASFLPLDSFRRELS